MAVEGETEKDRLSSLPNDILIGIISRLPFRLAVVTGCLSRRWRYLWTNIISININNSRSEYTSEFSTNFHNIMMQITSPVIHSFTIESTNFLFRNQSFKPFMDSLFPQLCDRNIRQLNLTGFFNSHCYTTLTLPRLIFQIPSLVSVELDSSFYWQLPYESDSINLPNLKNLRLEFQVSQCKCIEKLVKACPALEELSVTCKFNGRHGYYRCSNQNLRRLIMKFDSTRRVDIFIDTHKLDYLAFYSPDSWTFRFEEEPIGLREAKFEINGGNYRLSKEEKRSLIKYDGVITNVEVLSMDVFALYNMGTVFYNVTQLTVSMDLSHNIQILLRSVEVCPRLDTLILKFCGIGRDDKQKQQFILPNPDDASALLGRLKRLDIDIGWFSYSTPSKTFLVVVEYLLKNAVNLEHFRFKVVPDDWCCVKRDVERKQGMELNLCKLLYQCPVASERCEVEFVGKFFKMSRKAGPKVTGANGEVIPFSCSPWNGFTFEEE